MSFIRPSWWIFEHQPTQLQHKLKERTRDDLVRILHSEPMVQARLAALVAEQQQQASDTLKLSELLFVTLFKNNGLGLVLKERYNLSKDGLVGKTPTIGVHNQEVRARVDLEESIRQ